MPSRQFYDKAGRSWMAASGLGTGSPEVLDAARNTANKPGFPDSLLNERDQPRR